MKKIPVIIIYVLAFAVTFVNIFFSIKESVFSNINDLPTGERIASIENPGKTANITLYRVKNNIGVAVRGELNTENKTKNVFWQTDIKNTDVVWENDNVVTINGVLIDVISGGFYDCRRGISLFQEGAIEGGEENSNE